MYGMPNKYVACPKCKKWNMCGSVKCYKCGTQLTTGVK